MALTSKEHWNKEWSEYKPQKVDSVLFEDVFDKYLIYNPELSCLEIGCIPGNFLIYLHKKFGYKIYGIDYSNEIGVMYKNLEINSIKDYKIFNENFFSWSTNQKFDIVASFGFVEHFQNYGEVIEKHISLVKPNGLIIITYPNYRYGRYLLHLIFRDYETLFNHNLEMMDLKKLKNLMEGKGCKILFINYYRTFQFWMNSNSFTKINKIEKFLFMFLKKIERIFSLININFPNKYFSPFIVCIAKKI